MSSLQGTNRVWVVGVLFGGLMSAYGPSVSLALPTTATQVAAAEDEEAEASIPEVGAAVESFELKTPAGDLVSLDAVLEEHVAVVLVLRGFPGYQCPLCSRQVQQFISRAADFADADAEIVLVYPGPAAGLDQKAREFMRGAELPANVRLVIDPDYAMVSAWGLRWDAVAETAYPSTFVIGKDKKVIFAKVSREHGGRSNVAEVLESLK